MDQYFFECALYVKDTNVATVLFFHSTYNNCSSLIIWEIIGLLFPPYSKTLSFKIGVGLSYLSSVPTMLM